MPSSRCLWFQRGRTKGKAEHSQRVCAVPAQPWSHPSQPPLWRCYNPQLSANFLKVKTWGRLTSKAVFKGADQSTQVFFEELGWPCSGNYRLPSERSVSRWLIQCKILRRLIGRPKGRGVSCFRKVIITELCKHGIYCQIRVVVLAFPLASCGTLGQPMDFSETRFTYLYNIMEDIYLAWLTGKIHKSLFKIWLNEYSDILRSTVRL